MVTFIHPPANSSAFAGITGAKCVPDVPNSTLVNQKQDFILKTQNCSPREKTLQQLLLKLESVIIIDMAERITEIKCF